METKELLKQLTIVAQARSEDLMAAVHLAGEGIIVTNSERERTLLQMAVELCQAIMQDRFREALLAMASRPLDVGGASATEETDV